MLGWHGILAPAATPRDIVERLNAAVSKVLAMPDIRELWAVQNMEIVATTPLQFGELIRREHERYGALIRRAGIKLN